MKWKYYLVIAILTAAVAVVALSHGWNLPSGATGSEKGDDAGHACCAEKQGEGK